jgi:tetratricopeptide (TPR) repeat protein
VLINGQKLPAGTYSLHTIPGKDEWTIIFNSVADQWGSFNYDEKKDVLRVKARPQRIAENQEWLEFSIPVVTPNSAQVVIRWEKVAVPFTVEIPNVEALMRAKVDAAIAANPNDWRIPLQVANQYANDDKWEEAIRWTDQSIKVKETFRNLSAKAQFLFAAGRKDEAFAVAEQAIRRGKADKEDTSRFEKRLADMKAGKM